MDADPIFQADLIGFLAYDPELADEIYKIATEERRGQDMRAWDAGYALGTENRGEDPRQR